MPKYMVTVQRMETREMVVELDVANAEDARQIAEDMGNQGDIGFGDGKVVSANYIATHIDLISKPPSNFLMDEDGKDWVDPEPTPIDDYDDEAPF